MFFTDNQFNQYGYIGTNTDINIGIGGIGAPLIFKPGVRDGTIQDTGVSMHHAKSITISRYITAF